MNVDMYPIGSELCIRLTGEVYHYFNKIHTERINLLKKNTRDQAHLSLKRQEAIKILKKLHRPYFEFAQKLGTDSWVLKKLNGDLFIIFYK